MKKASMTAALVFILTGCAGQTAYETVSPVGRPVGTVLAAAQAPIQGAADSYAVQSARTQENPYGR